MGSHLVRDTQLQHCIDQRERPVSVKVVVLSPMAQDYVQRDRSEDADRDKRCEERELRGAMPFPKHEEQQQMTQEAGRPEEEVKTS